MRLAASIRDRSLKPSEILRKLGAYRQQNRLYLALGEIGRIDRTPFMLDWIENAALRMECHAGLNKGEARHSLARAVFAHSQGRIHDRSDAAQQKRAMALNDTTALEDMNQLIETLLDGIAREKDFRTETGDRSARDRAAFDEEKKMEPNETPDTVTAAQRAKRPEYEPGVVHTGDATEASEGTAIALRSGQSFRAWAQAAV